MDSPQLISIATVREKLISDFHAYIDRERPKSEVLYEGFYVIIIADEHPSRIGDPSYQLHFMIGKEGQRHLFKNTASIDKDQKESIGAEWIEWAKEIEQSGFTEYEDIDRYIKLQEALNILDAAQEGLLRTALIPGYKCKHDKGGWGVLSGTNNYKGWHICRLCGMAYHM